MDNSKSDRPRLATQHTLCIEVLQGVKEGQPAWTVLVSLPGREGTISHSWGRFPQALTSDAYSDLVAWVADMTGLHIRLWSGTQEVLPLA